MKKRIYLEIIILFIASIASNYMLYDSGFFITKIIAVILSVIVVIGFIFTLFNIKELFKNE